MRPKEKKFEYGIFALGLLVFICPYFVISYFQGHDPAPLVVQFGLAFLLYLVAYIWVSRGGLDRYLERRRTMDDLYRKDCKKKAVLIWKELEKDRKPDPADSDTAGSLLAEIERLLQEGNLSYSDCGIDPERILDMKAHSPA